MPFNPIKSISSEPRFGWTRESLCPEAYTRPLKFGEDIVVHRDKSLQATPSLVQDLAMRMQESALTAPRFVLLPNLTDFSQRIEDLRAFQKVLFEQVCRAVFKKSNYRINHVTRGDGAATRLDNGQPVDRLWTLKDLHQDANATFFSHLYGPIQHVKGGALTLFDHMQFLKDHAIRFNTAFELVKQSQSGDTQPVLKSEYLEKAEPYTVSVPVTTGKLEKPYYPLIFSHNKFLAHGVEPVLSTSPNFKRVFSRASVTIQ